MVSVVSNKRYLAHGDHAGRKRPAISPAARLATCAGIRSEQQKANVDARTTGRRRGAGQLRQRPRRADGGGRRIGGGTCQFCPLVAVGIGTSRSGASEGGRRIVAATR